jgi:signal transduction histidine kinase/CheY-like chemotaxis protein
MTRLWDALSQRIPLLREYAALITPAADLSAAKHVQLLKMTHARLHFSLTMLPFVSTFAVLFYGRSHDAIWLAPWAIGYCIAYWFSRARMQQFLQDEQSLAPELVFAQWLPRLKRVATFHGLALCAPFVLTLHDNSFEFTTLWYLAVAVIIAGNATHQTPVLGIFMRFFNGSWNVATLIAPLVYPDTWHLIMPMIATYTIGIYSHAITANKFFLQQVRLEENSTQLAAQFKLAKETAEDALKAKNQFLATASHDLRQPVHAMGMLLEAISHRNRDPSLNPALNDLRSSMRAMNLMFNSLLDLSKLEAGIVKVEFKPVHLQPAVRDIMALFEHEARDRKLTLQLHLPQQAAFARTDINLLRQVILNLVQNALRYTHHGGILIGLRSRGHSWQIEVWDTGIGVADDVQSEIYLPYFRHEHAWDATSTGHGLGLSVVARCALLMKADIGMNSKLGRGSRFWVRVPKLLTVSDASQFTMAVPVAPDSRLAPIGMGQCLIVEDDPQVARAWQVLMQSWQIDARVVSHSAEAFACLDDGFHPQVILCDERLRAGESGFELLKALLDKLPQAQGAMVSGEFSSQALQTAEDEGYLVFRKPVEVDLIHGVLTRWLSAAKMA